MVCRRYHLYVQRFMQHLMIAAILIVTICILIVLGSFLGSSSKASSDKNYKYYTRVEIKNGDTLWDIASEHITEEYSSLQEYVAEVKALNGLQGDSIRAGQSLIIPYYSEEWK